MPRQDVVFRTQDGPCPAAFFTPAAGEGPWPGVIFFMDGAGIRPAIWEMGQRLADAGYAVLLPDLYHRSGSYAPMVPSEMFGDPAKMAQLMAMIGALGRPQKIITTEACLDFLASSSAVKPGLYGSTGYCMGGQTSLIAAGAFPNRFAVNASFHGGRLATDEPDSPHNFASAMTGYVYVAGAVQDQFFDDAEKARLDAALTAANIEHLVETYDGALHGWAVSDMPVYNMGAAERHWTALLKIFSERLGG